MTPRKLLGYRLYRNPLVMFGLGPFLGTIVQARFVPDNARPRIRRAIGVTNVAPAVIVAALCLLIGWQGYLLVQLPPSSSPAGPGSGCSTSSTSSRTSTGRPASSGRTPIARPERQLLPRAAEGPAVLHRQHRAAPRPSPQARIPNYNLQRAHDANPIFHDVPTLTLADGLRAVG